jgi:hypothetical protein
MTGMRTHRQFPNVRSRPCSMSRTRARESCSRGRRQSPRAASSVAALLQYAVALLPLLLLPLLLLSVISPAKAGTTKPAERVAFSRELRRRQARCLRHDDCRDSSHDSGYSEDCELRCISPACHNQVYADEPLEEGEIDLDRALRFRACLARQVKSMAKVKRLQQR